MSYNSIRGDSHVKSLTALDWKINEFASDEQDVQSEMWEIDG